MSWTEISRNKRRLKITQIWVFEIPKRKDKVFTCCTFSPFGDLPGYIYSKGQNFPIELLT